VIALRKQKIFGGLFMQKKGIIVLALACLMIIAAFSACKRQGPQAASGMDRKVVIAIGADTPAIAPAQFNNTTGFYIVTMTHNGLFRIDAETLAPVPDLCKSWKAVSGTVLEFTIHEGIKFHNGEEMTSEDIVASWNYAKTFPISENSLRSLASYKTIDKYTVQVDTVTPNALLFNDLANHAAFIMPKSLIDASNDFNDNPIGSGPFVFEHYEQGDVYEFSAFKDYFDKARAAKVGHVTIRIIPEGFTRTLALEAGEIDYNVFLQGSDVSRLSGNPGFEVVIASSTQYNLLYLNNERPQFDSVHKRRAIGMAIDKEAMMMMAFDGFAEASWSQGPPVFPGATEEGSYKYDPEGARALLSQHNINPATLGFEILTHAGPRATMAQVVQADLAKIGIPVTIVMQDVPTLQQRLNRGEYEAGFMGFTQPSLLGFYRLVFAGFSIGNTNRSRVNNPALNGLIGRATAEVTDTNARNEILRQATILLNEQSYQIPFSLATLIRAHKSDLVVPEHASTDFPLYLNMVYWK
jgi:peptide/nickel transport system substrate-binding protein